MTVIESYTNQSFILHVSLSTTVAEQISNISLHCHFRVLFQLHKDPLFTAYSKGRESGMVKETVTDHLELLHWHSHQKTEENYENLRSRYPI